MGELLPLQYIPVYSEIFCFPLRWPAKGRKILLPLGPVTIYPAEVFSTSNSQVHFLMSSLNSSVVGILHAPPHFLLAISYFTLPQIDLGGLYEG